MYNLKPGNINSACPIPSLHAPNSKVVSCSPDKMVMAWDAEVGKRIRKWTGHTSHVNSCGVSRAGESDDLIVSGGDDGLTKVGNVLLNSSFPHTSCQQCITLSVAMHVNTDLGSPGENVPVDDSEPISDHSHSFRRLKKGVLFRLGQQDSG